MLPEIFKDTDFSWHNHAACDGIENPDIFYPPRDKDVYKEISSQAKAYCFGTEDTPPCPVRAFCLFDAVNTDEDHGIWGGMSHRERNAMVRKWHRKYRHQMTLKEYIFKIEGKR